MTEQMREELGYTSKTEMFPHQRDTYESKREAEYFALFWEMGLGKSKLILDVAGHLYSQGMVELLIILAPKSVYENWPTHEIPRHLGADYECFVFHTHGSATIKARRNRLEFADKASHPGKLRVVCLSYNTLCTERCESYMIGLAQKYRTMLVADESTAIKNHATDRAKAAKRLAKHCEYRWIATGTPVAQSPFDIHSPVQFLDPTFWPKHGFSNFTSFKTSFGVFRTHRLGPNRKFEELVEYQNLNQLHNLIATFSSRLLKEDSSVKLPPKMYSVRNFDLIPTQRKIYDALVKDMTAELDGGHIVEAPLAITRLTRLLQVTSGFVVGEKPGHVESDLEILPDSPPIHVNLMDPAHNPRLQLLLGILEECSHKAIIWCRFTRDVDLICEALEDRCVRYDGSVSSGARHLALERFRDPANNAQFFIANISAISQGVTLTIAKTMIYYSNSFSLEKRLQSEDRFHRIGQDQSVQIIDISANKTVDEKIIENLRNKYDIAATVTGDKLREWIGYKTEDNQV